MKIQFQDTKQLLNISDNILNYKFNEPLIHQLITSYANIKRQGSKAQKSRSEITGSLKKPWKQKGTGRARAGSVKSPIWRSGGVTFAAKPKSYKQKINKKMYRNALKSIISELFRKNRLIFFENFNVENHKTKALIQKLKNIIVEKEKICILVKEINKNLLFASRNLFYIKINLFNKINPLMLISCDKVILTKTVIQQFEENLT